MRHTSKLLKLKPAKFPPRWKVIPKVMKQVSNVAVADEVAEVVEEVAAREITLGRPAIPIAMNYSMLEVLMAKKLTNRKQRHIVAVADVVDHSCGHRLRRRGHGRNREAHGGRAGRRGF